MLCLVFYLFFFLMIRRPPRSTLDRSSAASDVYKRQGEPTGLTVVAVGVVLDDCAGTLVDVMVAFVRGEQLDVLQPVRLDSDPVSYTHLRAHETVLDLVCRLLLEKKKKQKKKNNKITPDIYNITTESTLRVELHHYISRCLDTHNHTYIKHN